MKRIITVTFLIMYCLLSAYHGKSPVNEPASSKNAEKTSSAATKTEGGMKRMETGNRAIIAKALGIAEDARNIRFILSGLDAAGVGQIKEASLNEENGGKALDLIAEDGVKYRVYLSARGNIDALKNLDTGEWLIRSIR